LDVRTSPIRFGIFEVDVVSGELRKNGERIRLQEQPFQTLVALLDRPGEVLTREQLQQRLWPADIVVDFDRGLNKAINRLREALGDDADNPRFIETLPLRGYRFIAEVETTPVEGAPSLAAAPKPRPPSRRSGVLAIAGGLIAVPLLSFGYRLLRPPSRRIESIAVLPLETCRGTLDRSTFPMG
jgi:DNA-binding winged helix-turn-helix (wHTH) protein